MYDRIIQLWLNGYSEAEIADRLGISTYEVEDVLDDWYDEDDYYDEEW